MKIHSNLTKNIGNRIKLILKENNVSQTKASKDGNLHINTLGHIIRGERETAVSNLVVLAHLYDINLDWLITGKGLKYKYYDLNQDVMVYNDEPIEIEDRIQKLESKSAKNHKLFRDIENLNSEQRKTIEDLIKMYTKEDSSK